MEGSERLGKIGEGRGVEGNKRVKGRGKEWKRVEGSERKGKGMDGSGKEWKGMKKWKKECNRGRECRRVGVKGNDGEENGMGVQLNRI